MTEQAVGVTDNDRTDAVTKLQAIASMWDTEQAHIEADGVLCDLLDKLGFKDVVEAYHRIEKWWA